MDTIKKSIGSKDSSIAGNNNILIKGLKQLYDQLLDNNRLKDKEISDIYASGMVTCPFGIKEVPHLSTPISLKKLCAGIYTHYEAELFKRDVHLIRGAKTITDDFESNKYNISAVNNMRGEEIEIFGILSELSDEWKKGTIAIFLPGSHTHIAYIRQGVFHDILSTFSGELFYAIATSTILSGSIQSDVNALDEEMVSYGFNGLKEYGINRALYIAHAMKIFNASDSIERKSYLEGVINGGIVLAFEKTIKQKWGQVDKVIIAADHNIAKVYQILLEQITPKLNIMPMHASGKESFAVKGFIEILKEGGARCQKRC
jgi:2-keto-3-deoxy-galactonokinase